MLPGQAPAACMRCASEYMSAVQRQAPALKHASSENHPDTVAGASPRVTYKDDDSQH